MSQSPPAIDDTPRVGGMRLGPSLTGVLYALLFLAAALALVAQRFPGSFPPRLVAASPWVFLTFAIGFGVYRIALVRARKYSAGKAFLQIGVAVIFFMLLLSWARSAAQLPTDRVQLLLTHSNPGVRALAAEVARYRDEPARYAAALAEALKDPDPSVRREAHLSLVRIAGEDLGPPSDPAAVRAWQERYP